MIGRKLAAFDLEHVAEGCLPHLCVTLTRDQMFTFGYRPDTLNVIRLGAGADGMLQALMHDAVAGRSE